MSKPGKETVNVKRYQKGETVTVQITDIGNEGEGIGKVDGYTLFIKDAVIGDTVQASIMKAKKNYAYAHLDNVITASKYRREPSCSISRQCGGCQLQNMTYEKQLEYKNNKVRNNIVRLGGFDGEMVDSIMEPIMGMEEPFRYRNKAQFPVGTDKNGKPVCGFYAGHSHTIIPIDDCQIGTKENKKIIMTVLSYMEKNSVKAYDEESGRGLIRHILIRKGFESGEIMVCLVINKRGGGDFFPSQEKLIEAVKDCSENIKSISVSINTEKTNVIMGTEIHTIWGKPSITDTLCGLKFEISPLSFYQVNPVQAEKLYDKAISYAKLSGKETVWDLYCGIGTITLAMSKAAGKVYGVEIIPQAIEDAKKNATVNKIANAEFYVGKAEEVLPEKYEKDGISADVIVVDPPRKGCEEKCLDTMLKMEPHRIVYVSCDSATLARDLRILCDGGYELKHICAADMFPWSVHVETVCLLSKLHEAKHHVDVKLNMDELDITSAESKATYEEIKKYVAEHNDGMKASSLNIAQVKAKYGIIERENYNKAKSEEARQPVCPKDKEEAIVEALKAFRMI